MHRGLLTLVAAAVVAAAAPGAAQAADARFATFNASLNRGAAGQLVADLSNPAADTVGVRQARNVAEVIQRAAPDVLLINEFDFVAGGQAARLFRDNFLAVSQNGAPAANYPYVFVAPSNTGIPSGFDLDNSGDTNPNDSGNDAWGFGLFPGQFGMVVYSKHPIDTGAVRTFQHFLWKDMPGSRIPQPFYSPEEVAAFRLSSKSHWDVPVQIGKRTVHFLVSHPTPPVFDGAEDRNGLRNADEIRFWADYVTPGRGGYIYDDEGGRGGIDPSALFVVAGDQNSDPLDGDSLRDADGNPIAIQPLLNSPRVNSRSTPESPGAPEASALQGGANATHLGDPRFDTADFSDTAPGNLRADYVLPSRQVKVTDSAVFWPVRSDPLFRLTGVFDNANWGPVGGFPTSDHRLVWADLELPGVH
ncbi:MAG TPA: endonuclease/exonuclease/phosphatase family protein [Solirubrobacteraceae bacterium]|nr:endonuclease/exonuclease/phosphatase family protein [Solirubrobacteraceae bacterium]